MASEIEIPKEFSLAKGHIETLHKQGHPKGEPCEIAACIVIDALVWALAGWMRERFEREHVTRDGCQVCGIELDQRHFWRELKQWLDAARVRLEEG